jgi:hypothetical protein
MSVVRSGRADFAQVPYNNAAETSVKEEVAAALAEEFGLGVIVVSPRSHKRTHADFPSGVERWCPAGTFWASTTLTFCAGSAPAAVRELLD